MAPRTPRDNPSFRRKHGIPDPSNGGGEQIYELVDEEGKVIAQSKNREALEKFKAEQEGRVARTRVSRVTDDTGMRVGPTRARAALVSRGATPRQALEGVSIAPRPEAPPSQFEIIGRELVSERAAREQKFAGSELRGREIPFPRAGAPTPSARQAAVLEKAERSPLLSRVGAGQVDRAQKPVSTFKEPFFSVAGQKERFGNVGATFGFIGESVRTGQFTRPVPVAPEVQDTTIGVAAQVTSTPVGIVSAPFAGARVRGAAKAGIVAFERTRAGSFLARGLASPPVKLLGPAGASIIGTSEAREFVARSAPAEQRAVIGVFGGSQQVAEEARIGALAVGGRKVPGIGEVTFASAAETISPFARRQLAKTPLRNVFTSLQRTGEEAFQTELRAEATRKGLVGPQAEAFVGLGTRLGKATPAISFAGQAALSGGVELTGQGAFGKVLPALGVIKKKGVARKTFFTVAPTLFGLGAFEGAGQEVIAQRSVGDARSVPVRSFDVGISAVGGAVSATILGGGIAAASVAGRTGTRRALTTFGNIIDPTEPVGDVLESSFSKAAARATSKPFRRVGVRAVSATEVTFGITSPTPGITSPTPGITLSSAAPVGTMVPGVQTPISKTPVVSRVDLPVPLEKRVATATEIPVTPETIVPTPSDPLTDPFVPPSQVSTQVTTPALTPAFVFAPVPVATPQSPVLPVLPPVFPFGTGTGGKKKQKRSQFANELAIGREFLKDLGVTIPLAFLPTGKKKGKRKRRKK